MTVFEFFDYTGTFACAISGALAAMNRRFDPFGVFILSWVTAIGGGSLRDMLIGRAPVGWMQDNTYIYLILIAAIVAMLFRQNLSYFRKTFFLFDSIGLATFTMTGVQLGLRFNLDPLICILLGTISASFGGLLRDILCNQIPIILHQEIYASASMAGGIIYLFLHHANMDAMASYTIVSTLILVLRIFAVRNHWNFPILYRQLD